mmetsp:Transcript_14802/g.22296  ORF Transcript_14802/g.22296 Transcript_14802/m.22296 type:complete len:161 (+) Transcript_14802:46-528(+)
MECENNAAECNSPAKSVSLLSRRKKFALYETISLDDRSIYHQISCLPISKAAEDDMELVSDIVTWGEVYLDHWEGGLYCCSRCYTPLYRSGDKWKGPCVWPSFRRALNPNAVHTRVVSQYNSYVCTVKEVYCAKCLLFIGHQFEDGKEKGDTHPDAQWRH